MNQIDYRELVDLNKAVADLWDMRKQIVKIEEFTVTEFFELNANAITDLIARAEAAENERDRLSEAMKLNCLQCESMHKNGNCMEVGGFCTSVTAAHCPLIPKLLKRTSEAESRAEKAEEERNKLAEEFHGDCYYCANKKGKEKCKYYILADKKDEDN